MLFRSVLDISGIYDREATRFGGKLMRSTIVLASALMLTGGWGVVGPVSAQGNVEFADAQLELEIARQELEAAAREVARLSSRAHAPLVARIIQDFQRTGR